MGVPAFGRCLERPSPAQVVAKTCLNRPGQVSCFESTRSHRSRRVSKVSATMGLRGFPLSLQFPSLKCVNEVSRFLVTCSGVHEGDHAAPGELEEFVGRFEVVYLRTVVNKAGA